MRTKSVSSATGLLALVAMLVLLVVVPAAAASPSELLQKAIYTEETVGNLDEAMKLYEQVIAEGKSSQEASAQAQYRLALCYQKKGRGAEAKAAFETLIENYPNAKDLVAQARKHLPSALKLLPAPWVLGERLQLNMKLPTGLDIGTMIYMVDGAEQDGKDITRCSTRGLVTINNASSYSWVLCEPESFKPYESFWKHSLLGEATAKYSDTSATISVVGRKDRFTLDFTPPAFDNEQGFEVFRRLPLEVGYKSTVTIITSLGGSVLPLGLEVPEKETLTVPAGTFECYKLVLSIGQTFWVSADEHRYVVRFAAGGVTADLAKIWQAEPGAGEKVSGGGFALTLPVGWLSYEPKNGDEPQEREIVLLDPQSEANCELAVRPASTLNESQRASTKVWTESFVDKIKTVYADFQITDAGFVETKVGGHAATQIVADFNDGSKKMRMLGVAVIGDKSAATMRFTAEATKFDRLRTDFKAVIQGFQLD